MRPDDDVGLAGGYLLQGLAPLRHALGAGEQDDVDGQVGQGRRDREVVLPGEDLGRGHYGPLSSRLDRGEERGDGDHGLSAAHVSLQEAAHRLLQAHVGEDLLCDPFLRPGQAEGEALQEGVEEAPVAPVPATDLCPLQARFTGRETGLYQEELVEDQAPHRRLKTRPLGREMDLVYRVVQIGQAVAHEHVGRQRVEDASGRVERAVDERPHPARLNTLVDRVDGDEASGVRSFVAPWIIDDLDTLRAICMP